MVQRPTENEKTAIQDLPAIERAAAIMHFIYIETIARPEVDWSTELADSWKGLDERARAFNVAILETWTKHPDLRRLWMDTIARLETAATEVERNGSVRPGLPCGEGAAGVV